MREFNKNQSVRSEKRKRKLSKRKLLSIQLILQTNYSFKLVVIIIKLGRLFRINVIEKFFKAYFFFSVLTGRTKTNF